MVNDLRVLAWSGYFANFGMETVAVREAARDPDSEHEWLGAVMLLRCYMMGPAWSLSAVAIVALHDSHRCSSRA